MPPALVIWILRAVGHLWALPTTVIGILWILVSTRGLPRRWRVVFAGGRRALHADVARLVPRWASAQAIGSVVYTKAPLDAGDRVHEHVHVRQACRLGVLFLPVYFACSLYALLRYGESYYDSRRRVGNPLEVTAYAAERATPDG